MTQEICQSRNHNYCNYLYKIFRTNDRETV